MVTSLLHQRRIPALLMTFFLMFSFQVSAEPLIYTSFFSNKAASGYDTVAYFTESKAIQGSSKFITKYKGAEWRFKNAENLAAFKANPEQYAPQYGGYCAWAVANNDTAKGDPHQWTVHNGKLYLNYDAEVQSKWLQDIEGFISSADKNWPKVIQ